MRQRSLTAPLILIAIGVLFLINNLNPGFSIGAFISRFWPFLLIVAGVLGLVDVLATAASGGQPGRRTFRGGWLVFGLLFIAIFGWSGPFHFHPNWGSGGVGVFGAEFDYDVNASAPADGVSRIVLDGSNGTVNVNGGSDGDVRITGRRSIRAFNKSDADRVNEQSPVALERQGDLLLVHTGNSSSGRPVSASAALEITIPKRLNVEARGRSGDLSINNVDGSVEIDNERGEIRLGDIGQNVRIAGARSGSIHIAGVKGNVDLEGHGGDVQLENIGGPVALNGEYSGTLEFRNLAGPMHFRSSRTDFQVASIPGAVRLDLGDLTLRNVTGPVHFESPSRDITATDVTGGLDLSVKRGDIHVSETKAPLPKMDLHSTTGDITLSIPQNAAFDLEGTTAQGDVQNQFGAPLETSSARRSSTIRGVSNGTGGDAPRILLGTTRGTITIEKN